MGGVGLRLGKKRISFVPESSCEAPLTDVDSQQFPGNDSGTSHVTLGIVECISYASGSEEYNSNSTDYLGCECSWVSVLVLAESGEAGQHDEEDGICVPEGC